MASTANSDRAPISRQERLLEIITVSLLAVTALATAWSGYQASLWDGIQSSNYTQASAARTNASLAHTEANQFRLADLSMFEGYIEATIDGNEDVAQFYEQRFRAEFRPAFDAWTALDPLNNTGAPPSPLGMPEYQLADDAEADQFHAQAEDLFASGEEANSISDIYTLTTLLFAAVLFFAAIAERFEYVRAQVALLILGSIGLIVGLIVALDQPITTG